ncbi:MAG: DUF5320 domain-containing protein [Chloroflexi bacterium]|nr:DUF5320 domain-containing protein [Chloroflexota bacterium]
MTGRGAGFCAGYAAPGYANPMGPRMGLGLGRARGWRHQFYATDQPGWMRYGAAPAWGPTPMAQDEADMLKQQADLLKQQLDAISKRLEELEGGK